MGKPFETPSLFKKHLTHIRKPQVRFLIRKSNSLNFKSEEGSQLWLDSLAVSDQPLGGLNDSIEWYSQC